MAFIELDENEILEAEEKFDTAGDFSLPEPGVYDVKIDRVYIDKTENTGTNFVNFQLTSGTFPNDTAINIEGWDVNRMLKNKDGKTKSDKGHIYQGVVLLSKIGKVTGAYDSVAKISDPTAEEIELFGKTRKVGTIKELEGKTCTIGIRHRKGEYEGKEYTKLEIINICKSTDTEAINKMKEKIEKRPVVEEKSSSSSSKTQEEAKAAEDIVF